MWIALVLLAAAFVAVVMVRTADPSFAPWAEPPAGVMFWVAAYRLGDRARSRAYPTRVQKVLAVTTLALLVVWVFAMIALTVPLRYSGPLVLTCIGLGSFALIMATAVCCYRARYFSWKASGPSPSDGA